MIKWTIHVKIRNTCCIDSQPISSLGPPVLWLELIRHMIRILPCIILYVLYSLLWHVYTSTLFRICEYRFSFEITPYGEILRVYHPPEENTDVLMAKKGFAALLASKLHNKENVSDSAQTHLFKSVSTVFNKKQNNTIHQNKRTIKCITLFLEYQTRTLKV